MFCCWGMGSLAVTQLSGFEATFLSRDNMPFRSDLDLNGMRHIERRCVCTKMSEHADGEHRGTVPDLRAHKDTPLRDLFPDAGLTFVLATRPLPSAHSEEEKHGLGESRVSHGSMATCRSPACSSRPSHRRRSRSRPHRLPRRCRPLASPAGRAAATRSRHRALAGLQAAWRRTDLD